MKLNGGSTGSEGGVDIITTGLIELGRIGREKEMGCAMLVRRRRRRCVVQKKKGLMAEIMWWLGGVSWKGEDEVMNYSEE